MGMNSIHVVFAEEDHAKFADEICRLSYESALQRGTGIAKRSPEYIASKIKGGKAVVALDGDRLVGFSYIECWEHGDYVATSGLIVSPDYRHMGLAARIKEKTFELARRRFPYAKIFSITTSLPVMKLNSRLGYVPDLFGADRRRDLLEGVRRVLQLRHPPTQPPPHVPLYGDALRPEAAASGAFASGALPDGVPELAEKGVQPQKEVENQKTEIA